MNNGVKNIEVDNVSMFKYKLMEVVYQFFFPSV